MCIFNGSNWETRWVLVSDKPKSLWYNVTAQTMLAASFLLFLFFLREKTFIIITFYSVDWKWEAFFCFCFFFVNKQEALWPFCFSPEFESLTEKITLVAEVGFNSHSIGSKTEFRMSQSRATNSSQEILRFNSNHHLLCCVVMNTLLLSYNNEYFILKSQFNLQWKKTKSWDGTIRNERIFHKMN